MTNLLLWSALIFVVLVMLWQGQMDAKLKKNILLGVTIPPAQQEHPRVLAIAAGYRKALRTICLGLAVLMAGCAFIPDFSLTLILWSLFFLVVLIAPTALFIRSHLKLKNLKKEEGWTREDKTIRVDVKALVALKKCRLWQFLLPMGVSLAMMAVQPAFWMLHATTLLMEILSYCICRYLCRDKTDAIDDDTDLTVALTHLRRRVWNHFWLIAAYGDMLLSLVSLLITVSPTLTIVLTVLLSLGIGTIALLMELHVHHLQEHMTAHRDRDWYVDDDDCWILGSYYYNPHDCHRIVPQRTGSGSTFNLATTGGKIITLLVTVLVAVVPVFMIYLAVDNGMPISMTLTDTTLSAEHHSSEYTIQLSDIESVELLQELPENMARTMGSASPDLMKGWFSARGIPSLRVLLDPKQAPFLKITTHDGEVFLFGDKSPDICENIFEDLTGEMRKQP